MTHNDSTRENRPPMLDTRPPADFLAAHPPNAVNIPLEELADRMYELPPPHVALIVFDAAPARAAQAVRLLSESGRQAALAADLESPGVQWITGPATERLWTPHDLLKEALQTLRAELGDLRGRTALDLACGCGRDAVFLAEQGLTVDAWDILPDALAQCRALAARNNVEVKTDLRDLENPGIDQEFTSYDLVSCFYFLHRPLFPLIRRLVRPGGMLVYETFVHPQGERFGKPRRAQFILEQGELARVFSDWRIVLYREGLSQPRKIAASLIAISPGD